MADLTYLLECKEPCFEALKLIKVPPFGTKIGGNKRNQWRRKERERERERGNFS